MTANRCDNQLLAQLPAVEWDALRPDAEFVSQAAGTTLATPGDYVSSVFFPTSGIISIVSSLASGERLEVATVGADGIIGIGIVLHMQPSHYEYTVQIQSTGYRIPAEPFARGFATLDRLRTVTLAYVGQVVLRAERAALCNRFHPHDQRLARWLLSLAAKSGQCSLHLTHDLIAQMIGGPRHAVTAALHVLHERGAIACSRGRIDIVSGSRLAACACECYRAA